MLTIVPVPAVVDIQLAAASMACQRHITSCGSVAVSQLSGSTTSSVFCGTPQLHAAKRKHGQLSLTSQKLVAGRLAREGTERLVCCNTAITAPAGTEFYPSDDVPNGGLQSDKEGPVGKDVNHHGRILSIETWIEKVCGQHD